MPRPPSAEEIDAAKTQAGAWTAKKLAEWGIPWPPPRGWRKFLIAQHEAGGFYVTPIPTKTAEDYNNRDDWHVPKRRFHYFPQADGRELQCNPAVCRECYREANWKEGQTHGYES